MFPPKAGRLVTHPLRARPLLIRPFVLHIFPAVGLAAALLGALHAQETKTVTVLMLDGKTGQPIVPSNLLVRVDHLDAIHNEWLKLNDDGTGQVTVPAGASFLSIQGTYENSVDIYVNCDAGMEKNTSTLHWYSIPEILNSGVATPNECYKGKYADATKTTAKPGQFILFVRKNNWHESPPE
jgi:hypothetical protein